MSGTLYKDLYTFKIISVIVLLVMESVPGKAVEKIRTHFSYQMHVYLNVLFSR